jgi:hypothetical protein
MESDIASVSSSSSSEKPKCKQRCVRIRQYAWTLGLSFGFIMAVVGAAFCITQKPELSIAGVVLSLVGVGLFVATLLFIGLFETGVELPSDSSSSLPPLATPSSLDPDQQGVGGGEGDGFYILDILSEDENSDNSF